MARPPKPPSERRSKWVLIRLTPGEHRRLRAYARRKGKTMAELIRQTALRLTGNGGESKKEEV